MKMKQNVILKYPNRKLYSKLESRYISLKEILALVRLGATFSVQDTTTKNDITAQTLLQAAVFHGQYSMDQIVSFINLDRKPIVEELSWKQSA